MNKFNIEIVAIGSELCYGKVPDTNSFWLADRITRIGGTVNRITCIRDNEDQICGILEESLKRKPRFLLITGGLGPTKDDITICAISKFTKLEIIIDELSLKKASERKNIPKDKLPPHFISMARTLSGAKTYTTMLGMSPATVFDIGETTLIVMPGPPKEVKALFETHISHLMEKETSRKSSSQRVIVEMVESEVTPITEDIERELKDIYIKPLVSEYLTGSGLPIEIIAFQENEKACNQLIKEAIQHLEKVVKSKGRQIIIPTKIDCN